MNISIQEQSFSFVVHYDIATPFGAWTATKKILSLLPRITLQSVDDSLLAKIEGKATLIRSHFVISVEDRSYDYHTEKLWKGVDICEGPGGPYRIYQHKGLRYSIFQADIQIASFAGNRLIVGNGKHFDLHVDPKADLPLVIAMVLCLNTERGDDHENSTVTYDFGNIGPEDRSFDDNWRPNDEL